MLCGLVVSRHGSDSVCTLASFYGVGNKEEKTDTAELASWQVARISIGRRDVRPFSKEGGQGWGGSQ